MRVLLPLVLAIGCGSSDAEVATEDDAGVDTLIATDTAVASETEIDSAADTSEPPAETSSETSGDTAAPPGDSGIVPTMGCKALAIASDKVDGANADTFAWSDADCLARTASLIRNDAADPLGSRGGYARVMTYVAAGKTRTLRGTGSNGWQGFGYVVSHYASTAATTKSLGGSYKTVLAGKHHALHEFKWRLNPGGNVDVTVHWFFATGRTHPLYAITYDATPAGADVVKADSRAPYGDLAWDDGKTGNVDGVGWGDDHAFATTSSPVTPTSSWDYTKTNTIPYAYEWSNPTDAEMGLVATLPFATRVLGGDYGSGTLATHWGKTGTKLLTDIPDWQWPFQLNQYELPFVTTSHRVAWGAQFGAVGQKSYTSFGKTQSGYPYQSYTVAVVLGQHAPSAVAASIAEMDALSRATLSATRGKVATSGAAGIGRTDTVTFVPAGLDPVLAAFTLDAEANTATATLTPKSTLKNPLFVIRGYTGTAPKITLGGKTLVADVDVFTTIDTTGKRLFITLNGAVSAPVTIAID